MELRQAIYGRRSVRDYLDKPLPREVVESLLTDAVQAPNSIDRQAWSFVVIQSRQRLARYSREALARLSSQPDPQLARPVSHPPFHIFYHPPLLLLIFP